MNVSIRSSLIILTQTVHQYLLSSYKFYSLDSESRELNWQKTWGKDEANGV